MIHTKRAPFSAGSRSPLRERWHSRSGLWMVFLFGTVWLTWNISRSSAADDDLHAASSQVEAPSSESIDDDASQDNQPERPGTMQGAAEAAEEERSRGVHWTSVLPPLLAIGLAVVLQDVLVALITAVWLGVVLSSWSTVGFWAPLTAISGTLEVLIRDGLVEPGSDDHAHLTIIFFTVFLGAMVGVLSAGGGMETLVRRISRFASSRRRGQLTTTALGGVIFFDDYANSMLLGSTMRPVTDSLRISREKLAFLVDSTAAPVAGLALISTWVGFEVVQIQDALQAVARQYDRPELAPDAYGVFLQTIGYRFYPILLLLLVVLIGWTGRDFGPMRSAESRVLLSESDFGVKSLAAGGAGSLDSRVSPPFRVTETPRGRTSSEPDGEASVWLAVLPVLLLCSGLAAGMYWTGARGLAEENQRLIDAGGESLPSSLSNVVSHADSNAVMLVSSFVASLSAVLLTVWHGRLSLRSATEAWIEGARGMVMPITVLILAWGVAHVCSEEQLNTGGYLAGLLRDSLPLEWFPSIVFVLAGGVSFATGTSWGTMAMLMPLVTPLAFDLAFNAGGDPASLLPNPAPVILATIGAVLAGAIWGDHCSPISDTTVLSSAASGCDHLRHVSTQLPYAVCVALVSIVCGYLPVGYGMPPGWGLLAGAVVLVGVLLIFGRTPDSPSQQA